MSDGDGRPPRGQPDQDDRGSEESAEEIVCGRTAPRIVLENLAKGGQGNNCRERRPPCPSQPAPEEPAGDGGEKEMGEVQAGRNDRPFQERKGSEYED